MKSISLSQRLTLIVLAVIPSIVPSAAQSLSAKEVKAALTSSPWKLETIWNPKDRDGSDSVRGWDVTTVDESFNYKDHFGIITFQFSANGTFKGTHCKGKQVEGKWSYGGKKKGFALSFEANVESDDSGGSYPYHVNFQKLDFKDDAFVAEGDICHDGCYQKVKFKKGN